MNGICGWIGFSEDINSDKEHILRMAKTLSGNPDNTNIHISPECAVALLSHDNPCSYSDEQITVVVSGNPYWSDVKLASLTNKKGFAYAFHEEFKRIGTKTLTKVNGGFSLAYIDHSTNSLLLAIDRIGICSMSYSKNKNTVIFGSTTKCVTQHKLVAKTINIQSIFSYLYFHIIPSPDSIFIELNKLEPAQFLQFSNGHINLDYYWKPDFSDNEGKPPKELRRSLHDSLNNSIRRSITSDNTGAFLSGGVDSSTVSGLLNKHTKDSAKTYSIGFDADGYDEMKFARISSNHFHTDHHEYYVTPDDVFNLIPKIANFCDEPFGNSSIIPTYYCAKLARNNNTEVLLAGDGGDELFAGNERYLLQLFFEKYSNIAANKKIKYKFESFLSQIPGVSKFSLFRKINGFIRQSHIPLPDRLQDYNFLNRNPLASIFTKEFLNEISPEHPLIMLRNTYNNVETSSTLNKMLYLDWKFTLADNDLRKVNQACNMANIRVNYPLLDNELIELSTKIPDNLKIKNFKLRHFFKDSLSDFLPAEVLKKSKHGFGLPFGVWLKTDRKLQDIAYDSVNDFKNRKYISKDFIDNLIDTHRNGHAYYYGTMLWVLMILELWLENNEKID